MQEQDGSKATTAVGTAIAEVATAAKAEQLYHGPPNTPSR